MFQLSLDLDQRLGDEERAEKLARNLEFVEAVAVQIFHKAAAACLGDRAPDREARVDATKLTLEPDRFEGCGLLSDHGISLTQAQESAPGIEVLWYEPGGRHEGRRPGSHSR